MDKELLITLIYKDLDELKILTKGFSEMENFPKMLVDLSVDKAKNIVDCLQKLPLNSNENREQKAKDKDEETEIIEETPINTPVYELENAEQQNVEEVFEILEKPIIEEEIKEEIEPIVEKIEEEIKEEIEAEIKEEILAEPQVEEQIEAMETAEIVVEQPKIEEKIESIVEKIEPKIEISVANPILQNRVSDLKQAFSIADRFRFQRELFNGNGEKFSISLTDLNAMETLEQAQNYIAQNLKLDLESPAVQAFMEILKRKLI